MIGFGFFMYMMERRGINGKDKYIIVIAYMVLYSLEIIVPDVNINSNFILVAITLNLFIPFAYLYIAIVSEGIVRIKAVCAFFGMMAYFTAVLMVSGPFVDMLVSETITIDTVHCISFITKSGVCGLFFYGFKSEND